MRTEESWTPESRSVDLNRLHDAWLNPNGYTAPQRPGQDLWDFELNRTWPLTLRLRGVGDVQPDRKFPTDGCSVPALVNGIPGYSRTRHFRAGVFHDGWYRKGKVWFYRPLLMCGPDGTVLKSVRVEECRISFAQANGWFRRALRVDGAPARRALIYWMFVSSFGIVPWLRYRRTEDSGQRTDDGGPASLGSYAGRPSTVRSYAGRPSTVGRLGLRLRLGLRGRRDNE